jgi:hypothetical protein
MVAAAVLGTVVDKKTCGFESCRLHLNFFYKKNLIFKEKDFKLRIS